MYSNALLSRSGRQLCFSVHPARRVRLHCRTHRCRLTICASARPTLLEVFSAVSEGRLSPVDAAQTVEEAICTVPAIPESAFPRVLNGQGKRAVDVGRQMQELQKQQGRVLVTGIEPADYAEIRKIVPGVQYHAGAKTLKLDPGDSTKLPGSIGIVSDMSVPSTAVEEVKAIAEYLGCYAFQIEPVTVTHLTDVMQQMKSVSQASVVFVVYDKEAALPDVISGLTDAPVISVRVGDGNVSDLPSGTLSSSSFVTAAYSAAKILKSVDRIRSLQQPQEAAQFEGVVVPTASIDEQIQDAMEILGVEDALRRNNVVSSDVREADEKIEKLSSDSVR